jgi:hypothetical protein
LRALESKYDTDKSSIVQNMNERNQQIPLNAIFLPKILDKNHNLKDYLISDIIESGQNQELEAEFDFGIYQHTVMKEFEKSLEDFDKNKGSDELDLGNYNYQ